MPTPICVDLRLGDELSAALATGDRIGIDTEFMRESTFFSQLCLLQVSAGESIFCIDPLANTAANAGSSWSELLSVPWVLHSGRQDIEVVYQTAGLMPMSVFDTQIAAGLLGYQPQLGYANLVADLFDVQLAKSHTRADWSKRPLTGALLEYAAEDVLYLLPAYDILGQRLGELGRLEWAEQDSAGLLQVDLYDINPAMAVEKLKGARNLQGAARNITVHLAAWREREALRSNRPRQWIVKDSVLLEIASSQPKSADELAAISGMSERTVRRASAEILSAVRSGMTDDADYRPPERPDGEQKALLKKLHTMASGVADDLGIAAEIIAPRKELSAAISGSRTGRLFCGWRADVVGDRILSLLGS